ncbi:MAG TPA: trigger factor [Sulfurimonas autotrophica]|nr:trigger factor [Sulfurimonas autotrophica]
MKVAVKKIDDINFIMSGTIENSVIENKVAKFKEEFAKDKNADASASESIEQEAAGEVFKEFIDTGIKEANINIETILGQPLLKKYEQQGENVYFEVALSTSPEIETNIDYADIIPSFVKPKADRAAVETKLTQFAQQQAPFTKIDTPRALKEGDVAVIDFKGYIDGKAFEGGSAERFNLKIGSQSFIPGFEEQLIGMEYAQEKTITVTFPQDYQAADLAGKETKFDVKLHEIQEQKAEEIDDAFAQKILSDPSATLETLKEKFADQIISEELSQLYMQELKPKIVKALLEKFDFTLPNNIVEQEIDAKIREKTKSFTEEEHKEFLQDKEKFLQLRESLRKEAQDVVKTALIVEALAKKEGVEVHMQEVHAALGYQAMMTGQDAQELVKYYEENNLMTSAKMGLTEDKLFGKLLGFHKQ